MAFTPQEQSIIDFGVKNGKSQQEVQQALVNFRMGKTTQPSTPTVTKPTYLNRVTDTVGTDIANRVQRVGDIQSRTDTGPITKAVQTFGQGAGLAANTLETVVGQIPGVSKATETIGSGINLLATSEFSPIKHLGDVIGSSKTLQEVTKLYDTDPSFKDSVDAFANTVRLGGDVATAVDTANFTENITKKVVNKLQEADLGGQINKNIVQPTKEKIAGNLKETPSNIMNRVARLKPTDEVNFTKLSNGKTPGEYLTETGNFGTPDKVISTEASKFKASMDSVDAELAKLPGVYKDGSITDALTGLLKKSQEVSGANVKAPYYQQVLDLIAKYNSEGLTMDEINTVKRLYERNVKLGYNKLVNGAQVENATLTDSALRNWQIKQANDLGFKNIYDLNKQTQLSKFLVNKLGDRVIGQTGLNGVSLTDWIVLSGGDVSNIAGFLTKKFFSDPGVQAKIAEIINKLNNGEVKGLIKPETTITPANIERRVSPQGLKQLNAPVKGAPQSSINTPINQPSARAINSGTEIVPKTIRETQTPQQPVKKVSVSSPNPTTPKPTVKPVINSESSLLQEAKKYKSAEEFVKAKNKTATGAKVPDTLKVYALDDKDLGQIYRQSGLKSSAYPADFVAKNDIPELKIKKGDKVSILANDKDAKRFTIENIPERKTESGAYSKSAQIGDLVEGYSRQDQIDFINKNFSKEGLTKSQLTDIWNKANKK